MTPRAGYLVLAVVTAGIGFGTVRVCQASFRPNPRQAVASFVSAVNRRDWRAVCATYSPRYLKSTQAECRSLWWWGWRLYGPYRYRVLHLRRRGERYHVELVSHGHPSYFEVELEDGDWKVVAGGW
jgi:hypothetical protein